MEAPPRRVSSSRKRRAAPRRHDQRQPFLGQDDRAVGRSGLGGDPGARVLDLHAAEALERPGGAQRHRAGDLDREQRRRQPGDGLLPARTAGDDQEATGGGPGVQRLLLCLADARQRDVRDHQAVKRRE